MLIVVDGKVIGAIAVADEIKEGAAEAIAEIKKMGYRVALLTGDNHETAAAIAEKLRMTHVLAEVLLRCFLSGDQPSIFSSGHACRRSSMPTQRGN